MKVFNPQKPATYLLLIPLALVACVLITVGALVYDMITIEPLPEGQLGFPLPFWTIMSLFLDVYLVGIVTLVSLLLTIYHVLKNH